MQIGILVLAVRATRCRSGANRPVRGKSSRPLQMRHLRRRGIVWSSYPASSATTRGWALRRPRRRRSMWTMATGAAPSVVIGITPGRNDCALNRRHGCRRAVAGRSCRRCPEMGLGSKRRQGQRPWSGRAAIRNKHASTVVVNRRKSSEDVGARTQDLRIKSPLLYRLSYILGSDVNRQRARPVRPAHRGHRGHYGWAGKAAKTR